ncbi:MAG: hypothetical protein ACW99A_06215 [Candidatus Kariarchaeaceae archaeon]|jgi:hypothetical protein
MTEEEKQPYDEDRERMMRWIRFAGLFIALMIIWYSVGLAEVV